MRNFLKMMIPVLLFVSIAITTGCTKDETAPVGSLYPPQWLIGTWETSSSSLDYTVERSDFSYGQSSFKGVTELANLIAQSSGSGTVKVKEIKKTDTEYQVGRESRGNTGPPSTTPNYHFKKIDGETMEVAEYNNDQWGEFKTYTKKAE